MFVNTLPYSFSGSTDSYPFLDPGTGALDCFEDLVTEQTAGVWFEYLGRNSCIHLSTNGSALDTILVVYEGDCSGLNCILGNDDASPNLDSELLLFTEQDKRYRILVGNSIFKGRGNFTLNITVGARFANEPMPKSA